MDKKIVLIAHNLRSTHNVGSLLRTADGLGADAVYLTGYTPYPKMKDDQRLPHQIAKLDRQISKTALGAEKSVKWRYTAQIEEALDTLKLSGFKVVALEQAPDSIVLHDYKPPNKVALVVGNEIDGLDEAILKLVDKIVEIPMLGQKESFNVSVAAAIALQHLRYT